MRMTHFLAALALLPSLAFAQATQPPGLRLDGDASKLKVMGRSLAARAQEEINAFDEGVVCDGATDNAAKLASIATKLTAGKTLYFPPSASACMTSAPLVISTSKVTVRAIPGTVTLKAMRSTANPAPTNPTVLLIDINKGGDGVSDVLIYGVGLDGGGRNFFNPTFTAAVYRGTNVVFDRTAFANTPAEAYQASESSRSGVRGSTFSNIGNRWRDTGLASDRKAAITICCGNTTSGVGNFASDNQFDDVGLDAITGSNQRGFRVALNRCRNSSVPAERQSALLSAPDYPACVFTKFVIGASVVDNISEYAHGNGFDIADTVNYTISGNVVRNPGSSGIGAFSSKGVITGNSIFNVGQSGIANACKGGICMSGARDNVTIVGNNIVDDQATKTAVFGIEGFDGACTGCLIDNNTISGFKTSAYGGYLTGPTVRSASAGGTGLTGGAWTSYTPTFTPTDGSGVSVAAVNAAYEQIGKTLRVRATFQVNYTSAPTALSVSLPNGQSLNGGFTGAASNGSAGHALQLVSGVPTVLVLKALGGGLNTFLTSSGQYLIFNAQVEVQ